MHLEDFLGKGWSRSGGKH